MNRTLSLALLFLATGAAAAEDSGAIHVRGPSGLDVWLDGERRGATSGESGLKIEAVEPGSHLLKVVRIDFQPRVIRIDVKAGEIATWEPPGFEPPIVSRSADDFVFRDDDLNTARLAVELLPMRCRVDCETLDLSDFETPGGCWILEGIPVGEHRFRFSRGTQSVECARDFKAGEEVCLRVNVSAGSVLETRDAAPVKLKEACRFNLRPDWSFVGFTADGGRAWVACSVSVDVFSATDGTPDKRYLMAAGDACARAFHLTRDGEKLLTCRALGPLRRWDTFSETEDAIGNVGLGTTWKAWDVSRDAGVVAKWEYDRVEVWNVDHETLLWTASLRSRTGGSDAVLGFSADDRFLVAAGGEDRKLTVYESRTGKLVCSAPFGNGTPLRILPSGDADLVGVLCGSGMMKLWSMSEERFLHTIPAEVADRTVADNDYFPPTLSSQGLLLLVAGLEPGLELWDYRTGRRLQSLPGPVTAGTRAVFSPDGTRLLVARKHVPASATIYEVER